MYTMSLHYRLKRAFEAKRRERTGLRMNNEATKQWMEARNLTIRREGDEYSIRLGYNIPYYSYAPHLDDAPSILKHLVTLASGSPRERASIRLALGEIVFSELVATFG